MKIWHKLSTEQCRSITANVWHKISAGLKAVSCPAPMKFEKGNTVQFGTNTRINFMQCYLPFFTLIIMRLEQITKPFLESGMSIKEFSDVVGLTSGRVSQILIRDLNTIHYKLFKDADFDLRKVPLKNEDRQRWLNRVNEYIEIINLPDKIKRDNRKISDLTVEEFIALMSSLNGR